VLLRPDVPAVRLGWRALLAGVAVAEAVERVAKVEAALKWPNDLLVRGCTEGDGYAKCAGILAEAVADTPDEHVIVLGVGLNVSQTAVELPPAVDGAFPPTSLALSGAASTDRDPILRAVLRSLDTWYQRWRDAAADPDASGLGDAYRRRCITLGREVTVSLPAGEAITGTARAVDSSGHLVVATAGGERVLAAGDVRHVR
jgi:BirA family biotin operon repressor/biotin-[acetyl-CoA-carboxylase] ligase